MYHKKVKVQQKQREDGGVCQQRQREIAEKIARCAAQSGDAYDELLAKGARYHSKEDWRRAARTLREAIVLEPDTPVAYFNLAGSLANSAHFMEAAQRFLEARERYPVGSKSWAEATAAAFNMLTQDACAEVAKPEWWNDEGLQVMSARVVRMAPDDGRANQMRAEVLSGRCCAWEVVPRSAAELKEAATHYDRAAALCPAPATKAYLADNAARCHRRAEAMPHVRCAV